MRRFTVKVLSCFIPSQKLRKKLRNKYMPNSSRDYAEKLRKENSLKKAIFFKTRKKKVYYFDRVDNMGDLLNKNIYEKLFNSFELVSPKKSDFLMIGSILHNLFGEKTFFSFLKKPVCILGAGFIQPSDKKDVFVRPLKIKGLRGKISKKRLEDQGFNVKKAVLGDWGLITSILFPQENIKKKFKVGIIPHYIDKPLKEVSTLKNKYKNSKVLDITKEPISFIKDLLECETIISSAMHGLILADSYNIPNLRISFKGSKVLGGDYKFNDYYSIYSKEPLFLTLKDLEKVEHLDKFIKNNYNIDPKEVDFHKENIMKVFNKIKD